MKAFILFALAFFNVSMSMAALPTCVKNGKQEAGVRNFFGGQRTWSMRDNEGTTGTLKINFDNPLRTTLAVRPADGSKPVPFTIKNVYYNGNNCGDLRASVSTFTNMFGNLVPVDVEVKFAMRSNGGLRVSGGGKTFDFRAGSSASASEQLDLLPEGLFPEQSTTVM